MPVSPKRKIKRSPVGQCWACKQPVWPGKGVRREDKSVGVSRWVHFGECLDKAQRFF